MLRAVGGIYNIYMLLSCLQSLKIGYYSALRDAMISIIFIKEVSYLENLLTMLSLCVCVCAHTDNIFVCVATLVHENICLFKNKY